ncbi:uncharacterized protein SCHCODRAFT_01170813 [Schizophyllum commune H4-8]|nr:uncharacterized protein SCHCODRAFT_01170813 [Schizophyllum commune H4-8]KAI5896758.1 hypothetical protein SCHCODRAFT_01170813 [Schizophyllum commune H4-8]
MSDNQPPAQAPEEPQELLALQPPNSQPVRKLAPELLTIVFEHALPADWTTTEPGRQTLNFAQVSHTWRAVAFSSPSLWKKIYWKIPSPYADESQYEEALELYLQRSRKAYLSLQVSFESRNADIVRAYMKENRAWKRLRAEAYRWQALTLARVPPVFLRHTKRLSVPALRELHLLLPARRSAASEEPLMLFRSAPELRHFEIKYPIRYAPTHLPNHCRITKLELSLGHPHHTSTVFACARIARLCAGTLEDLYVVGHSKHVDWRRWPAQRVCFPVLKKLSLIGYAIQLCHAMIAPALKNTALIWIYVYPYPTDGLLGLFLDMVRRSAGCTEMISLALGALQESTQTITECLAQLGTVRELKFFSAQRQRTEVCVSEDIMPVLTRRDNDVQSLLLLPRLSYLGLGSTSHRFHDEAVTACATLRASRAEERIYEGQRLRTLKRCHMYSD